MAESPPGTTYSLSQGNEETSGKLFSVSEVQEAIERYDTEHGAGKTVALTVWELPPDGNAAKPHPTSNFWP